MARKQQSFNVYTFVDELSEEVGKQINDIPVPISVQGLENSVYENLMKSRGQFGIFFDCWFERYSYNLNPI